MEDHKFQQMQDEMSRFEAEISGTEAAAGIIRPVIGSATYGAVQQRLERGPMAAQFQQLQQQQQALASMMYPSLPPPPPPPPSIMVPAQVQRLRNPLPAPPTPPLLQGGQESFQQENYEQENFQQENFHQENFHQESFHQENFHQENFHQENFHQENFHQENFHQENFHQENFPQPMPFLRPGLPGPQLIPPPPAPPKPQPIVLSAAPKLYKKPQEDEEKKEKKDKESKKRKREPPPPPPKAEPVREPTPPPVVIPPPPPVISADPPKPKKERKNRKVVRTAGGQVWEDVTLLDWPDDDFRMFCGDLGNDVTDELLTRTFSKYTSFQRAKVIRDKRTNKSKGFGFVSFKDPGDFIKAMKEMDGRYVGSRPIKLRKSSWKNRSLDIVRKKEKEKAALLSLLMTGK